MNTLKYAGASLAEFGVYFDSSQIFNKPEKLYDSFSIPNRNGSLMSSLRRYNNIQISYDCYIKTDFKNNYSDLIDYLTSFDTYQKLENSVETGMYRMAIFHAETTVDTGQLLKDGMFTLVFDCKPQIFYNSGDQYTRIATSPQGNQWTGQNDSIDGINIIYSNGTYRFQGYKQLMQGIEYTKYIPIPSAGNWTIRLRVLAPDITGLGARSTVGIENQFVRLDTVGANATVTRTTSGSSTLRFQFMVEDGWYGSLDAMVMVELNRATERTYIDNPSRKESKPLFMYQEIDHDTSIYLNDRRAVLYNAPVGATNNGTLYIDCELMDCYILKNDGTIENANPYVTMTEFPTIKASRNSLYCTYGTVNVAPRWWRL